MRPGLIVRQAETELARRLATREVAALHAALDLAIQQGLAALVAIHDKLTRSAANHELKYLSHLSHDLSTHMAGLDLMLRSIGRDLADSPHGDSIGEQLDVARRSMHDTLAGTRRLLAHERLGHAAPPPDLVTVDVAQFVARLVARFAKEAQGKGLTLASVVRRETRLRTDPDLLTLVMQNLVGNAIKYSAHGRILVGADRMSDRSSAWEIGFRTKGRASLESSRSAYSKPSAARTPTGSTGWGSGCRLPHGPLCSKGS